MVDHVSYDIHTPQGEFWGVINVLKFLRNADIWQRMLLAYPHSNIDTFPYVILTPPFIDDVSLGFRVFNPAGERGARKRSEEWCKYLAEKIESQRAKTERERIRCRNNKQQAI